MTSQDGPYARTFLEKNSNSDWFRRTALTNGERWDLAPQPQADLWSQMRFGSSLVETPDHFYWWNEFLNHHTQMLSAPLMNIAPGPCQLTMCYFEFRGIPRIVVPVYHHMGVALAQGIVKLTHGFDTHGFFGIYEEMPQARRGHLRTPSTFDAPGPEKALENMGVMLIAQVCKSLQLHFLFASPIKFFRHQLLIFVERNHIQHWLAVQGKGLTSHGPRILTQEVDMPAGHMPWSKKPDFAAHHLRLQRLDGSVADLGLVQNYGGTLLPNWDIVRQTFECPSPAHKAYGLGNLSDFFDENYPYNFLFLMGGDGMIVFDAHHVAEFAPLA